MSQQVLEVLKSIRGFSHVPVGGLRALVHEMAAHLRQIHGEPELVQAFATRLKASLVLDGTEDKVSALPQSAEVESLKKELTAAAESLSLTCADAIKVHGELQEQLDKMIAERDDLKHGLELATQSITNHIAERDALQAKLDELSKAVPDAPASIEANEHQLPADAAAATGQPAADEVDRSTTGQAAA